VLADSCGHEECVKAIDDYFNELSATSAGHHPNTELASTTAYQPGTNSAAYHRDIGINADAKLNF